MKLTKRQLKQIIREEYYRLKQQGLIREAWNPFDEPKTELKGDTSKYSTGDQPISKHGETMAELVHGVVVWCRPKKHNMDMSPEERANWVYKETHVEGKRRGYYKYSEEIAEHALEELGLSEFKRTSTPTRHYGWHMSDR